MNICEPFRQTAGDIAKICDANFHHRLVLNIGEAIPWYLCMFLSFSCEWRSSVVQARMCKLGRDPLIFLKILVVIGHVCIYWSKVAEGFSVFNAVLLCGLNFFALNIFCEEYVEPGGWINIKMPSYQYRKSHCGDKTVVRSSYLHNGISYTGKMTSLYWIGALVYGWCCKYAKKIYCQKCANKYIYVLLNMQACSFRVWVHPSAPKL